MKGKIIQFQINPETDYTSYRMWALTDLGYMYWRGEGGEWKEAEFDCTPYTE